MPAYDESQLTGYLEGLRISVPMIEIIRGFVGEYRILMGAPPEYLFVENPINPLGAAEFSNLILLAGEMYMEFSLNQPNRTVTLVNIPKNTNRILMPTIQQLSFDDITERSRLTVQIYDGMQLIGFFTASGPNCADLLEMTKRYFMPALCG